MTYGPVFTAAQEIAERYSSNVLRMVLKGDFMSGAITSPTDRFRFVLGREWLMPVEEQNVLLCVGVNPSRARHDRGDHTITKLGEFGRRHHCSRLVMINLFAWSDKDPKGLVRAHADGTNIVGHPRDFYDRVAALLPNCITVCMWGKTPKAISLEAQRQKQAVVRACPDTKCFGMNLDMSPKHPLRLAYSTPLVRYG